jgi:hypothetical protein
VIPGLQNFLFSTVFRPKVGPTKPPIQWALKALSRDIKCEVFVADCLTLSSADDMRGGFVPPIPISLHDKVLS